MRLNLHTTVFTALRIVKDFECAIAVMIPPYQVHSSKINGAVVNLRAKGDKLGVSEASTIYVKGILSLSLEKLK